VTFLLLITIVLVGTFLLSKSRSNISELNWHEIWQ
jgi:hypothetical protein